MKKYSVKFLAKNDILPSRKIISAVFLIAFSGEKVLAIRNERGWDIPGGHLEGDEDIFTGLEREVKEEAGASFDNAMPYAVLSTETSNRIMLFFVSPSCSLGDFTPSEDALERDLISINELISRYYGDKDLLLKLLEKAKEMI